MIRMLRSDTGIFDCCSQVAFLLHSATRCCLLPLAGNYGYAPMKPLHLAW